MRACPCAVQVWCRRELQELRDQMLPDLDVDALLGCLKIGVTMRRKPERGKYVSSQHKAARG
jgi:hypothetical protein